MVMAETDASGNRSEELGPVATASSSGSASASIRFGIPLTSQTTIKLYYTKPVVCA